MAQPNVCVRCCEPLGDAQPRFNHVFWGMAHRKCSADAVWPPQFRPTLDPNEVMRQIAALVAHLAKISTGLPIPQILPNRSFGPSPRRSAVERPVLSVATPLVATPLVATPLVAAREEKDDLGVESLAKPPSEDAHATEETTWRSPTPRKRAQRPPPTPKATPSPKLKEAKHGEREEAEAKHDERDAAPVPQQQADKPNPPPPSPKPSPKGSRKKSDSKPTGIPVTNLNTLREYNLQKAVQAAKGRFVTVDTDNQYNQSRQGEGIHERQFGTWQCCAVSLEKWMKSTGDWTCDNCQKISKRGDAGPEAYRSWDCWEDSVKFKICLDCLPVVLKTPFN